MNRVNGIEEQGRKWVKIHNLVQPFSSKWGPHWGRRGTLDFSLNIRPVSFLLDWTSFGKCKISYWGGITKHNLEVKVFLIPVIVKDKMHTFLNVTNKTSIWQWRWEWREYKVGRNTKLEKSICYISLTYKEHLQIIKEKNSPVGKILLNTNRQFTQEEIQMVNSHLKRCSISICKLK